MNRRLLHRLRPAAVILALAVAAAGCGNDDERDPGTAAAAPTTEAPVTVRLGYFPNITHATAIAGVERGIFAEALGPNRLETQTFNAGPAAVEALLSGAIDATYIGPNPAINAYVKSGGKAVRIISGATSGGAALVVKPGITTPAQLKGKKLATPQLGNTQDVALRYWLSQQGLKTDPQGGGDVSIVPQENAQTLETFKAGAIDGAWLPEPWSTRLVREAGAHVLVDEATLWPGGRFVTTHLLVRTEFLEQHPAAVRALLRGQVEANDFVNGDPATAQRVVNDVIARITGKRLADPVIAAAWEHLTFTNDPVASSLRASAKHAEAVGLLDRVDLDGIYDLRPLNEVLRAAGQPEVTDQ